MSVAAATREAFKMLLKVILLSSSWKVSVCNILLIILGFLTITASAYSVDNNPYRHKETLDRRGKYELEWLVEMEQKRITFNVTVQTKGYVGLGLSRRGKMAGADLVIGGVNHDGEPYFYDMYAIGNQFPLKDDSQDWKLLAARESETHTFLSFSRSLETCDDDHDLPIDNDVISVIWAFGERDNITEYHHHNRGDYNAYFLDPNLTPRIIQDAAGINDDRRIGNHIGNWKIWTIERPSELLLPQDTSYICTFHRSPSPNRKHHVVGYRSVLSSDLERRHIHHFLIFRCTPPPGQDASFFDRYVDQPGEECYVVNAGTNKRLPVIQYCNDFTHEWAVGATPIFFPEHVGIPIGESPNEVYMLQAHYDNPESLPNIRLNYAVEVYYTDQLRKEDAGLLFIGTGTPGSTSIMLPPSELRHVGYGHCGSACTKQMLPETGIQIFAAKLHTHLAGTGARFLHLRDGKELPWLLADDFFNFNFQPVRVFPKERTLLPGDTLIKRCIYATTDRNGTASVGGFATRNEMCNGFLWYYPYLRAEPYAACSSEIRADEYREFLQIYNVTWSDSMRESIVTSPPHNAGLRVSEVGTNIHWTIDKRNKLQHFHRYLPQITTCQPIRNSTNSLPSPRHHSSHFGYDELEEAYQKEIISPQFEHVSIYPKDIVPYERPSVCGSAKTRHRVSG